ncbi:class I SAM-dependent methyltransferase [Winogradskyella sp. PE311]|uniref:class I SAM-dependent methyltransferase n=1 Tax=Winogradskyella sp. PE311 TaxID=3366943 RepID=UPI00397F1211
MKKIKNKVKSLVNKLPYVRVLYNENKNLKKNSCYFPGHFYSPIVSIEDIKQREAVIWENKTVDGIVGIDLNTDKQLSLVESYKAFYDELPFEASKKEGVRYYFENPHYSYTDAIFLYSTIRHFKPKQIIEVGSGFTSALMLDTNELFFSNSIKLTFIEPYTKRLKSLLREGDASAVTIIEKKVQDVPKEKFLELNAGDVLFIDSTHVVKTGSDVSYLFLEILPILKSGVLIHIHDVFYPFEYPKEWVYMGRNWNEDYFLKAFLLHNKDFEILLFSHYLDLHHNAIFKDMPLCYKNTGGNIWLRKM